MSRLERLLAALAVLPFAIGFSAGSDDHTADDHVVFSFADPAIVESSGLIAQDGLFATVNDSGDSGRVFTLDPADGSTVAVTAWAGEPTDVEAIAPLPDGALLVGDIGDNSESRDSIELLRVPFGVDGTVDPETYQLVYPDGAHDAESLLVNPVTGQVLVVAKEFIGRLYAAPTRLDPDGPNQLRPVGEVMPVATDGAFFPDGRHFVLRGYGAAEFYAWPSLEEVGHIELPTQEQGEGLAVDRRGRVYLSSEGQYSQVLQVVLPDRLRGRLGGAADQPDRTAHRPPDKPDKPDTSGPTGHDEDDGEDAISSPAILLSPWVIGGAVILIGLVVLLRSLRPRP